MPGLAAVLDEQAPLEHHILRDFEHALFEHRPHLVREPVRAMQRRLQRIDQQLPAASTRETVNAIAL